MARAFFDDVDTGSAQETATGEGTQSTVPIPKDRKVLQRSADVPHGVRNFFDERTALCGRRDIHMIKRVVLG
jgi:hypothetical protein